MIQHYTAIIVKCGDWFAGTIKELTGVHTQGKTIPEVKENLVEAIQMILDSNLRHFKERMGESEEYLEEELTVNV